jgi:hypothetical protein
MNKEFMSYMHAIINGRISAREAWENALLLLMLWRIEIDMLRR